MRDIESDWSMSRDTQKSTNQVVWQIQVVNPDPASDCTAQSSLLSLVVYFFLPFLGCFPSPVPPLKLVSLVFRNRGNDKNDLKRQSRGTGPGGILLRAMYGPLTAN